MILEGLNGKNNEGSEPPTAFAWLVYFIKDQVFCLLCASDEDRVIIELMKHSHQRVTDRLSKT